MKRISFLLIVFVSIIMLSASYEQPQQEKYYYAFDEKIFLSEAPNKIIASFNEKFKEHVSERKFDNNLILKYI